MRGQCANNHLPSPEIANVRLLDGTRSNDTTVEQAFRRIRTHARNHNVAIGSVAEAIVKLGLKI